jgi:hypothetical protein
METRAKGSISMKGVAQVFASYHSIANLSLYAEMSLLVTLKTGLLSSTPTGWVCNPLLKNAGKNIINDVINLNGRYMNALKDKN